MKILVYNSGMREDLEMGFPKEIFIAIIIFTIIIIIIIVITIIIIIIIIIITLLLFFGGGTLGWRGNILMLQS